MSDCIFVSVKTVFYKSIKHNQKKKAKLKRKMKKKRFFFITVHMDEIIF